MSTRSAGDIYIAEHCPRNCVCEGCPMFPECDWLWGKLRRGCNLDGDITFKTWRARVNRMWRQNRAAIA